MLERNTVGARCGLMLLAAVILGVVMCTAGASADEFRGFWVDTWGNGIMTQSQVDTLLGVVGNANSKGQIRDANCNAVIIEVRRNADACYPSSMGEPYMSGLTPSDFNALQAVINAAHDTTGGKKRIEVHCWIVTFRTSGGAVYSAHDDTPTGSLTNLDNYWPTRDDSGAETSDKAFDPGHPKCEDYIVNVAMDLVNNFDIDGIHFDYIRFTANNQGYNPTSVARYNAWNGLSGQPSSSSTQFQQWRRDQVSAFVRKVYARVQASKPRVKVSGSFVTWNPSPTSSTRAAFQATRPYYDVYSDWDSWLQEGIVDAAVPMTYYNWASLPSDYTRWMNWEKDRHGNRHMYIGPGIYLNSLANTISELQMTRDPSPAGNYAQGWAGYSYRTPYNGGSWSGFAPTLTSQVTSTWADVPDMPWKSNPTKGHISGTITSAATGAWIDGATVTIAGPINRTMRCDGTGFYAFIDLTPGAYTVTVNQSGYPTAQKQVAVQIGSVTGNMYVTDFQLGSAQVPPVLTNVQSSGVTTSSATITWSTDRPATSRVDYGLTTSYGSSSPLDSAEVTSHSVSLSGLAPSTVYHYRVRSSNSNGETVSGDYTFVTAGPPTISNVQATNVTANSATITWNTNTSANSAVNYGLTASYGSQVGDPAAVVSHSITLAGLTDTRLYHFQCVSSNGYGTAVSADATFTTLAPVTEIVVDNTDPGWANTSPDGNAWSVGSNSLVPMIGVNYLYRAGDGSTNESSSTRKCTWTPYLTTTGLYDVWVYYQMGTNRNSAAPYSIHYDGGQLTSIQNQHASTANQGGWFLIGQDLPFVAGNSGYVELTTATTDTAYVSADAAKFVLKSVTDTTAPTMSSVTDDTYTTSTTSLNAAWSAIDPESVIQRYEYAVGTTPGATNVKGWTSAGTATSAAIGGLSLTIGTTCYVTARAVNSRNLTSEPMSSAGVTVARAMPAIQAAKGLANGEPVRLPALVVSAKFADKFYIEEPNRTSGIRIQSDAPIATDQWVTIYGVMGIADSCERAILSPKVVIEATPSGEAVKPFLMVGSAIGGGAFNAGTPGVTGGVGLYNVGMLIRIAGRVGTILPDGFVLNDGSKIAGEDGEAGIRVYTGSSSSPGTFATVTGVVSCYSSSGKVYPMILAKDVVGL